MSFSGGGVWGVFAGMTLRARSTVVLYASISANSEDFLRVDRNTYVSLVMDLCAPGAQRAVDNGDEKISLWTQNRFLDFTSGERCPRSGSRNLCIGYQESRGCFPRSDGRKFIAAHSIKKAKTIGRSAVRDTHIPVDFRKSTITMWILS